MKSTPNAYQGNICDRR